MQPPGLGGEGSVPRFGGESRIAPGIGGTESGAVPGFSGEAETGAQPGTLPGAGGGMFGGQDLTEVLTYVESHGGGTIAVESQSDAAGAIIESGAEVAGIGGFSGKESSVSTAWLEEAISSGRVSWILSSGTVAGPGGAQGGDSRTGSESALDTVIEKCEPVSSSALESSAGTLYACSAAT
jgi:hypothetical protein